MIDINSPTLNQEVASLCCSSLEGWGQLNPSEDVKVSKISGGITNILLKVQPAAKFNLEPVAFRVFGENTEVIIDRDIELRVIGQLNEHGFGARILHTFENGRIESFLYGRALDVPEFRDPAMSEAIANRLASFHAVPVKDVPEGAQCFAMIRKWLDLAEQLDFSATPEKQRAFQQIDFKRMREEVARAEAMGAECQSPVRWCHNDLLSGNVMILDQDRHPEVQSAAHPDLAVQFIDFEYGAYNPRGFDIGNHFNEWAGFDCDYSLYPDQEQQRRFLRSYLLAASSSSPGDTKEPTDSEISKAMVEANVYSLASHMYWGTWAILQARYSPIDFDYLSYVGLRWGECRKRWDEVQGMLDAYSKK